MSRGAEDRVLSPHTGWTRRHWEAVADELLHAVQPFASPRRALIDLPGRPSRSGVRSDGLEGYARTFLLAAFRVAGSAGADPHGFLDRYAEGLVHGTRSPGGDEADSWPLIRDHTVQGQPMVESASVAIGLHLTRPWLWDNLTPAEQDRAESWLRDALRHFPAPNNWYLFPLMVAGFLESVGRADTETRRAIDTGLSLLDGWYRGDGWYSDGDGRAFDHYNGWALHLYPMLHAHLRGDRALLERFGPRLREFLDGFSLLFDRTGSPLYQGRSLTYRIAAGAAVALGALTGHTPLEPGASRRVLSGALRYFLDRGAAADGYFSLGWHGPHEATLQNYSGPASPFWASKGFLALLLPPDDPLWTSTEVAAPAEGPDRVLALRAPGFLIQTTQRDGLARVHNHGSDKISPWEAADLPDNPLYSRLAYSTRTGPTSAANVPDNHVAVGLRGRWSIRGRIHPLAGGPNWLASSHRPIFLGGPALPAARVDSLTLVRNRIEVRIHRLVNVPEGAEVRLTGWAVARDAPAEAAPDQTGEVRVTSSDVTTQLVAAHGFATPATLRAPQGTAYGRWAAVPALFGAVAPGPAGAIFVSLASLTGEADPAPLTDLVGVTVSAGAVDVRWQDARSFVDLTGDVPSVSTVDDPGSASGY
jgi:hypothetical protein